MQWHFEEHEGTGVLHLSGFLGERVVHRFQGAFAWARARSEVALVLDLSGLLGWSPEGMAAIIDAARQLGPHHAPLTVCGLRTHLARQLPTAGGPGGLRLHPDPSSAPAAVGRHTASAPAIASDENASR
ncbi:STAS domain-containing protein [Kitasatospora sp. NPDC059571]|uniref:STAS domain-containing protein n=1 Tax=Kitasatospora sp. NPDC059571 TaxID=3346871 RepID=UPI0036941AE7